MGRVEVEWAVRYDPDADTTKPGMQATSEIVTAVLYYIDGDQPLYAAARALRQAADKCEQRAERRG